MNRLFRLASIGLVVGALLAGCGGSGKVYQPLRPTAIYTFGDGIVDDGQTGGKLYTINSSNPATIFVYSMPHMIASSYGLTLKAQSAGGTAWGQGGSGIAELRTQIQNQASAAGFTGYDRDDLIILSAGMEDLMRETQSVLAGSTSTSAATENIKALVRSYGQGMLQLHGQGARYIYILPPYDLTQSPWMKAQKTAHGNNAGTVYLTLYNAFISAMAAEAESVNGQTQSLLLSPGFRTRMGWYTDPGSSENNANTSITHTALCAAPGDVDASLCNDTQLITSDSTEKAKYLFADNRHPVPVVLTLLANGSVSELKDRWGEP